MKKRLPAGGTMYPSKFQSRRWIAVGAGLVLTAVSFVSTSQSAAADYSEPVARGPRPTAVLAVSGSDLVISDVDRATGIGRTLWSTDNGAHTTAMEGFAPTRAADYVRAGTAVWVDDATLTLLDLTTGTSRQVSLERKPAGVSDAYAVVDAGRYKRVDLATMDSIDLALDSELSAPASAIYPRTAWVIDDPGLLRLTRFYSSPAASGYSRYVDVDPMTPGDKGPLPFRLSGWVPYVGLTKVPVNGVPTTAIEYVQQSGTSVKYCTRLWLDQPVQPKAVCRKLLSTSSSVTTAALRADRYGQVIGLSVKGRPYLYEAGKLVKVVPPAGVAFTVFAGTGDPTRPLVRSGDDLSAKTYAVNDKGQLALLYDDLIGPKSPVALDLSATRLAGLDGRERRQAWYRSIDASALGDEEQLAGATRVLQTTAGRMVADTASALKFYDGGTLVRSVKAVTALNDASGPYTWVTKGSTSSVLRPDGTSYGTRVAAIFGSRVVEFNSARTAASIRDLVTGSVFNLMPASDGYRYQRAFLWGDHVVLASTAGTAQLVESWKVAVDHFDEASLVSATSAWPVALGDGVAVLLNANTGKYHPWRLDKDFNSDRAGSEALGDADATVAPAVDPVATMVYSTGTSLKVVDLGDYHGTHLVDGTEARLLGAVAPAKFEVNDAWALDLDLSKAVEAGEVRILDQADQVVRTIPTPASADGSLRAITWDAIADDGTTVAPDGTYTWTYVAESADGTGPVTAVAGDGAPTGSVAVYTTPVKASAQKVTGTAKVGAPVRASGGWTPAHLTMGYQWYRSGVLIPDATAVAHTITPLDLGKTLKVVVTGTNRRGTAVVATSASSKKVALGTLVTKVPTVSGAAIVGTELSVDTGAWSPKPTFSYAWYRNSTRIIGEVGETYTLALADAGKKIRVKVSGSSAGYTTASKYSAYTATVK
jgi:hypothetical protein